MWEVSSAMQAGPEKDCDKKDNSVDSCTNTGSSLNSHNRPHNASSSMVKDNRVNYLLEGMTNKKPVTKETNNKIE